MTTVSDVAYRDRLLGLLAGHHFLDSLADSAARVEEAARRLGPSGLAGSYGPGKWTGAEVLGHLADAELAMGFRTRQVLTDTEPHLCQEYDESAWLRLQEPIDVEEALRTFLSVRRWNLRLFRSLSPAQLGRRCTHPSRGEETLATALALLAGHTLNHLAQLESL